MKLLALALISSVLTGCYTYPYDYQVQSINAQYPGGGVRISNGTRDRIIIHDHNDSWGFSGHHRHHFRDYD